MLDSFVNFVLQGVGDMGYGGIVLLMALESSFVPFPSEVVVPPAGYLAAKGDMNIYLVILSGITGSLVGALINYLLAVTLGRTFIIKYGRYFFLTEEKFAKVEKYFSRHGEITTFVGRLIPVIRQYISFPAGAWRMNLLKFCIYTALGAGIWVIILAYTGYIIGNNIELLKSNLKIISFIVLGIMALVVGVYVYFQRRGKVVKDS